MVFWRICKDGEYNESYQRVLKDIEPAQRLFAKKRVTKVRLCDGEETVKTACSPRLHVLLRRHSHLITLTRGAK